MAGIPYAIGLSSPALSPGVISTPKNRPPQMKKLLIALIAALPLTSCSSTASLETMSTRFDAAAGADFEWDAIGVPAVDGTMAGAVAYGKALQASMVANLATLDFPVIEKFDAAVKVELDAVVAEGEEPTEEQLSAAVATVRSQMNPEEQAAMDAQVNEYGVFLKTVAAELAEAGVKAVAAEAIKDVLTDSGNIEAAKDLGFLQGLQAVRQMNGALDMVDMIIEMEGIRQYQDRTKRMWEAAASSGDF
jgi:hypothetical protein